MAIDILTPPPTEPGVQDAGPSDFQNVMERRLWTIIRTLSFPRRRTSEFNELIAHFITILVERMIREKRTGFEDKALAIAWITVFTSELNKRKYYFSVLDNDDFIAVLIKAIDGKPFTVNIWPFYPVPDEIKEWIRTWRK